MKDRINSLFSERFFFLLIMLLETGIFLYLIHGRWIVGGQDGFQYFVLQYSFLNHVVHYGEIPQWMPFMTQGTVATWWHAIQAGILQNVLLLTGSLFKEVNFLPLFYAGIFLDELLLLAGVWLLGKRFFASPFTLFFVTLSVMGSCIWVLQPWWNFHFYYAIPLMLYLIHLFLDSGKWRYYFLAGNLLFIQCLGNLPYFLPVTSLVIFLYFLFYFIFNHQDTWHKIKNIRFGWSFVLSTLIIIASFIVLYIAMNHGTDQIANHNVWRNPDGTTTLDGFLTYGGKITWRAWLELILGISPFLDYTLYIGILCVPFILLGLIFNTNKQNLHFLLTVMVLLLFSMGTLVSVFFYYSWPMMKFFRHLALVSPIIKVFLCFLAGFGFDAVFFNKSRFKNPVVLKISLAVMAVLMIVLFLFLRFLAHNYYSAINLLLSMVPAGHTFFRLLLEEPVLLALLNRTAIALLISSVLFFVLFFVSQKKYLFFIVVLLLFVHCADIYGFKFSETRLKSAPLNEELYKITCFQPSPYSFKRDVIFLNDNPRAQLLKVLPIQYAAFFNWTTHSFLFKDELGNPFRTDHWLLPLDNYMRAYLRPIHNLSINPHNPVYDGYRFEFPQVHPAIQKISGVTEDKIQFFSGADFISSDDTIASLITDSSYKGDMIFLSAPEKYQGTSPLLTKDLSLNKRLHLPYQVLKFNANHLEVTANNDSPQSVWLFYSDVWHPLWRATVNGKDTPVYKANLAYKAVKLEPGPNKVHFYFKSRLMSVIYLIFGLNALVWLGIILYLNGKIIFNKRQFKD